MAWAPLARASVVGLANAGKGGLILWPMFGATNQLLGGLAFLVILFWLKRRGKPTWFLVPPLIFMLVMPAWAMAYQLPGWWAAETKNWMLIVIALATLALELWMVGEALALLARTQASSQAWDAQPTDVARRIIWSQAALGGPQPPPPIPTKLGRCAPCPHC